MKRILILGCILLLAQAACVFSPTSETPTPTTIEQSYPLEVGAFWVYEGTIAYEQNGTIIEEPITWRVEVLEKTERQFVTGYKMRGSLRDLSFYIPRTTPSEYSIMQIGGRFYNADMDTYARLTDMDDLLIGLVSEYNLFLDLPLAANGHFCETEQLTRDDGGYCWMVGEPAESEYGQAFPLTYGTLGDFSQFEFVPGVGFTAFTYHHNGSTSDANVELIEYGLGE